MKSFYSSFDWKREIQARHARGKKKHSTFRRDLLLLEADPYSDFIGVADMEYSPTSQTIGVLHREYHSHMVLVARGSSSREEILYGVGRATDRVLWLYVNIPDGVIIRKHAWQV